MNFKKHTWLLLMLIVLTNAAFAQMTYPGAEPGIPITYSSGRGTFQLENNALKITFNTGKKGIYITSFLNKESKHVITAQQLPLFEITLANGKVVSASQFQFINKPKLHTIEADSTALILDTKTSGKEYSADFADNGTGLEVHWEIELRSGNNYLQQFFTIKAKNSVKVNKITLLKFPVTLGIKQVGTVDGSPLVTRDMFFALEHPMSRISNQNKCISISLPRSAAVTANEPLVVSAVWGVTPPWQLRRGFLYYTERQRARPYHQMLHYNSWFDLSWQDRKLNETDCLDRIKAFKDSLIIKRNVKLDAFLFDDGWDNNESLWQFNKGFPDGFTKLAAAAMACKAGIGVWISPWGGYDGPKIQRLAYGKRQSPPFEINENGFSLTGPVYYDRFKSVTTSFIKNYNVSIFKFDGVGAGNGANGASLAYQKDIEAFLKLITVLRAQKPDIYLSLTVGTWPSVYWLKYGDAIWRAGDDTGLDGAGPKRQQWITYKDGQAYRNIVQRAPLYPLNSVMYHGVCIASNGLPGTLEMDDKNIADEIWAFFGTGTSLQELYVDPHLLNKNNWDCLAKAAGWAKKYAQQLRDTHWVGGDPSKGEVYGYAGWASGLGVLSLRNPSPNIKTFKVTVKDVLNIPGKMDDRYTFKDAKSTAGETACSGRSFTVTLAPFEVKVMNAALADQHN